MDKRIKELALQAGLTFSKDWGECYTGNAQLERFAELVRQDERELAKPEQEPVAYVTGYHNGRCVITPLNPALIMPSGMALYIAPLRKPWVGLTGIEINHIFAANVGYPERMCRAIEAKLKEKNDV
jgi:hypothetical protein